MATENAAAPIAYAVALIANDDEAFKDNLCLVMVIMFLVLTVHVPLHFYAQGVAKEQKREARRKEMEDRRRGALQNRPRDGPISQWEWVSNTFPRVEMLVFFICYQGLAQSTSAVINSHDENASTGVRVLATFFFVLVVLFGVVWVAFFVRTKIMRQHRAILVKDKVGGYSRWKDTPPPTRSTAESVYTGQFNLLLNTVF